jgi:hypothetical protein
VPLPQIKDLLFSMLRLQGLSLPAKNLCIAALALFVEHNISFPMWLGCYPDIELSRQHPLSDTLDSLFATDKKAGAVSLGMWGPRTGPPHLHQ